jgi:hypothetical protein
LNPEVIIAGIIGMERMRRINSMKSTKNHVVTATEGLNVVLRGTI